MNRSGNVIQEEYLQSLNISRNFNVSRSFESMTNLFEDRRRIAELILKYGETKCLRDGFIYVNRMIFLGLGLFVDNK